MQVKPNVRKSDPNEQHTVVCRCSTNESMYKTTETPYKKGFCVKCSAWQYTSINPMSRSILGVRKHVHSKRILNNMLSDHLKNIELYKQIPAELSQNMYVETIFQGRRYHLPIMFIVLWSENTRNSELLPDIIPHLTTVRN